MKLTKGMKKALSLLLVGALAITGANISTESVSARLTVAGPAVMKWTGTAVFQDGWNDGKDIVVSTDEGSSANIEVKGFVETEGWGADSIGVLNVTGFEGYADPRIMVVGTEGPKDDLPYAVCDTEWNAVAAASEASIGVQKDKIKTPADVTTITGSLDKNASKYYIGANGRTLTAIYVYDAAVVDDPTTYEAPVYASEVKDFTAKFGCTGSLEENSVEVTGDGVYALSAVAGVDFSNIGYLGIETTLTKEDLIPGLDLALKAVSIKHTPAADGSVKTETFAALDGKDDFCYADSDNSKNLRVQIINQWAGYSDENGLTPEGTEPGICAFEETLPDFEEGSTITAYFEVKGTGKTGTTVEVPEAGEKTEGGNPGNPGNTQTPAVTKAPTTGSITATPSGIATPATASLKVAKKNKNVVVAAGKSKSVKFTKNIQAPATKAAAVKATVKGNKKVTAKVSGSKVKITAKKKAVKGSKATVTLTSKNASGTAVKATIKVTVQNKAKKIKAKKKSVTIKKGKKAKVTIKVTAQNKKKATSDTVTATVKKVAKVTKKTVKKGKVVLTLKAKKKGSAKMTVKVGKKKVKVNVKVK